MPFSYNTKKSLLFCQLPDAMFRDVSGDYSQKISRLGDFCFANICLFLRPRFLFYDNAFFLIYYIFGQHPANNAERVDSGASADDSSGAQHRAAADFGKVADERAELALSRRHGWGEFQHYVRAVAFQI